MTGVILQALKHVSARWAGKTWICSCSPFLFWKATQDSFHHSSFRVANFAYAALGVSKTSHERKKAKQSQSSFKDPFLNATLHYFSYMLITEAFQRSPRSKWKENTLYPWWQSICTTLYIVHIEWDILWCCHTFGKLRLLCLHPEK